MGHRQWWEGYYIFTVKEDSSKISYNNTYLVPVPLSPSRSKTTSPATTPTSTSGSASASRRFTDNCYQ